MKLSDYCILVKTYIDNSLSAIDRDGCTIGYNNKFYYNHVDFLDGSVVSLVEYVLQGDIEKDCDYATAFKLAGIVDGYLKNTNILGKMVGGKIGNIFGKEG